MSETPVFLHEPKTRHIGSVRIPPSQIANMLRLPEGADIRSIVVDSQLCDIVVVVEHPNLPEVDESCYPPPLEQHANVEHHIDSETAQEFWTYHVRPVIPETTGEHPVIECNRPAHQDGHHGPECYGPSVVNWTEPRK